MSHVRFIAEVSSNHHRDLERCYRFIDTAANIGCSGVKFQLFKIEQLFAKEILCRSELHRERRKWELPIEYIPLLAERCALRGVSFGCTPFSLEAVSQLQEHVDFLKISSYEMIWPDLLEKCGKTGLPIVLSTGMATLEEVAQSVEMLKHSGCDDLTLLHCVSGYPTPVEEVNLAAIETLEKTFACKTGWSDHSVDPAVVTRAVHRWNASMIEFHLDLDGDGAEFSSGHCWLPEQIGPAIRACRTTQEADGDGKKRPVKCELPDRSWRADPKDGLRPLIAVREQWIKSGEAN